MTTIPAPTLVPREEWPDADFDIPEGHPIHVVSDKEEDEDWDVEMHLGPTGGVKAQAGVPLVRPATIPSDLQSKMITIRPPLATLDDIDDDSDDDEGVSTIKVAALPKPSPKPLQDSIEEDFEDGFALPSDLTQLSLAPLSLKHQSSKSSIEWGGDKDQTSSSQSSDAFSTLGFADASPSSNSASSVPPDTETEDDDDDEGDLEGLVIPNELFESRQAGHKLAKMLELKKTAPIASDQVKLTSPDPEDDFEMGLVIDDDVDFSPSRLLQNAQQQSRRSITNRSNSVPPVRALRPPSRKSLDRAKSPTNPPPSSARQLQKLRLSPSPPLQPPLSSRAQTFQSLSPSSSPPSSFLSPKSGSLRGQKSHSGLKPPTPPSTGRRLTRKASLSSFLESSSQVSGTGSSSVVASSSKARYEEPTAASRARSQKQNASVSRLDYKVPPTRPSTPQTNTAALRLTMPTRIKSRPALSSIFQQQAAPPSPASPMFRNSSPLPARPPSSLSKPSLFARSTAAPRVLKRPKRIRTYGDGTELDGIEDLPTDRDKESRFRVQPKGYGNRIPGGSYSSKAPPDIGKGTIRRKTKREVSSSSATSDGSNPPALSGNPLKRPARADSFSKPPSHSPKKKKLGSPNSLGPSYPKRKPVLIKNLNATSAPKVVGDMRWNPQTLRWEGNEQVLRDFDAVVTSTRPALITHLTGSSIGSPVGSFASGARRVGNMIFDPARMCWISTLEEDEPDVFANLADDEDDDFRDGDDEEKGRTIRASAQTPVNGLVTPETSTGLMTPSNSQSSFIDGSQASPARSQASRTSDAGSVGDRGSRASVTFDVDDNFLANCRAAEERHRVEMKGWINVHFSRQDLFGPEPEPDRAYLYEIRALATRKY